MEKLLGAKWPSCLLFYSVIINLLFSLNVYLGNESNLSWSNDAASQAESVAAISCSGHGRAYLDGLFIGGKPVCECNLCFSGSDCSVFLPECAANADGGDPLFLEPFWMQHAASSALVVAGWHRMSYSFSDGSYISSELDKLIRQLHAVAGNAITKDRYIIFGAGSTQVLTAAVRSLSPEDSSSPAKVVVSVPFYSLYQTQVDLFRSVDFTFEGDTSFWKNSSDATTNFVEFVTSPNNPDAQLNKAVLSGPYIKTIYDRAYYWPHYTPIPEAADDDLMIFTMSKITGHAGSRFGWAVIKDQALYEKMNVYMQQNTMGVSRDTQLRAFKLLKVVLEGEGREIFEFGHAIVKKRWEELNKLVSASSRFSLQKIAPRFCTFFQRVEDASPAYAWMKCEREEDSDCYKVLKAGNIYGRQGTIFGSESHYVRLSLIRSQDDFDILIKRLKKLIFEDDGGKVM